MVGACITSSNYVACVDKDYCTGPSCVGPPCPGPNDHHSGMDSMSYMYDTTMSYDVMSDDMAFRTPPHITDSMRMVGGGGYAPDFGSPSPSYEEVRP